MFEENSGTEITFTIVISVGFEKLCFEKGFVLALSNSSGLMNVLAKLRFCEGLVWTVGLAVEKKLQISRCSVNGDLQHVTSTTLNNCFATCNVTKLNGNVAPFTRPSSVVFVVSSKGSWVIFFGPWSVRKFKVDFFKKNVQFIRQLCIEVRGKS